MSRILDEVEIGLARQAVADRLDVSPVSRRSTGPRPLHCEAQSWIGTDTSRRLARVNIGPKPGSAMTAALMRGSWVNDVGRSVFARICRQAGAAGTGPQSTSPAWRSGLAPTSTRPGVTTPRETEEPDVVPVEPCAVRPPIEHEINQPFDVARPFREHGHRVGTNSRRVPELIGWLIAATTKPASASISAVS